MFVKVEPRSVSQECTQKTSSFTRLFFQHLRTLVLFGCVNPGKSVFSGERSFYSKLKRTYIVAIVILYLMIIPSFCFDIYKKSSEAKDIAKLLAYLLLFVSTLELALIHSHKLPKLLPALEESFARYETQYTLNKDVWKLPHNLQIVTLSVMLYSYVVNPISFCFLKKYPGILCESFPICFMPYPWQDIFFSLNVIAYTLLFAEWLMFFLVCVFFSLFFMREFKAISKQFSDLSTFTYTIDQFEKHFEELTKHFESLTDLLNEMNCCVQHYSFIALFSALPIHCSLVYAALDKKLATNERMFLCLQLSLSLILTGVRIFMEALVSFQAHEPLQYLWKMKKDKLSEKALQQLNFFVSRLTGDRIGFSIYGFLTMTMPTLLAIFGTLATYFIIAVQFYPQDNPSQCDLLMKNITYCLAPL